MLQPGGWREAFGQSFDKAEDAFIGALANKWCWLLAKEHTQALIVGFRDLNLVRCLLAIKANRQFFISHVKAIVDQVADQMTINRANKITWLDTRAIRGTFWHDFTHPSI
jgi:ABC-type microcin C transport system duplicated ATPase subunit YejF